MPPLAGLPPLHRDPFDRLLVAQALQHGLMVATVDPAVTALRAKNGRAFDTAYVVLAGPHAHEAAVRLYEAEAKEGRDAQLRAFAARTLPTLNAHLGAARQLAKAVATAQ